mmetsp:Transcript_10999/g.34939  ORF Transcript_10999/g.34939 Transcript_10999/m.34939 type:complete len:339 (-) Transcript_10999:1070-2086(-)
MSLARSWSWGFLRLLRNQRRPRRSGEMLARPLESTMRPLTLWCMLKYFPLNATRSSMVEYSGAMPSEMTMTRSHSRIKLRVWDTATTVEGSACPASFTYERRLRVRPISTTLEGSCADTGSSSITIGLLRTIVRARAMRWRCPPEKRLPLYPAWVLNPSGRSMMSWYTQATLAAVTISSDVASVPMRMFSATERLKSDGSCSRVETIMGMSRSLMFRPPMVTSPREGRYSRVINFIRVDLPLPERPTMPTFFPAGMRMETSRSTGCVTPSVVEKLNATPRASMSTSAVAGFSLADLSYGSSASCTRGMRRESATLAVSKVRIWVMSSPRCLEMGCAAT